MATLPRSWETKPGVESALGTLGTLAAFYLFAAPLCVAAPPAAQRRENLPRVRSFFREVAQRLR